jgi:predicted metal-dependent hydrolase
MEELWLEEGRSLLYQGLLQAAVGLHHWRNGNHSGAAKLFAAGLAKLSGFRDEEMGVNLVVLKRDIQKALEPLNQWLQSRNESNADAEGQGTAPRFQAFDIAVCDPGLTKLMRELAEVPYEERLHETDEHG